MKTRQVYICSNCGAQSPQWRGQCLKCHEWNTLEQHVSSPRSPAQSVPNQIVTLADLGSHQTVAAPTGLGILDDLLGGGLTPGAALLLGGEPGIGKSTLLLQLAGKVADKGRRVVYLTAEESLEQLGNRARRLGALSPQLSALAATRVEEGLAALQTVDDLALLVVDSVQMLTSSNAEGLAGGVNQVRAVSTELVEAVRKSSASLLLVGHVTKDGQLAGPKLLEHMVDTVLSLEGDRRHGARLLRVLKNRFGPTQELLVFQMTEKGLEPVEDPSAFFLEARDPGLPGTAVVMAVEGGRPLAVEVQALTSRSYLTIPRRTALGLDSNRLHLLLAVLERRLKLNLGQSDIYVKVGGGLRVEDPGLDLGLAAAILSSHYDLPAPENAVFWGEVDLNGRIRPVDRHEQRLVQARRLGLDPILSPGSKILASDSIQSLQKALFSKKAGRQHQADTD